MGAHDFTHVVRGIKDASAAYDHAVKEALHEHGQDPYNGTISTTNGCTRIPGPALSLRRAEKRAYEIIDQEMDKYAISKWGNAGAIPLLATTGAVEERSKKVTLDAVEYASYERGNRDVIDNELRPLKGYEILDWQIVDTDLTTKVKTSATDGERETRYLIEGSRQHNAWETGFASQAEARAYIDKAVKEQEVRPGWSRANESWGIYAVTRRADGSPLVVTKRLVKRAVLTVKYRMEKVTQGGQHDGWLFFGMAAS